MATISTSYLRVDKDLFRNLIIVKGEGVNGFFSSLPIDASDEISDVSSRSVAFII